MKIPLALSALILAIGASFCWSDYQRLAVVSKNHTQLVAEAATLGIALDPSRPTGVVRTTKHRRGDKQELTPKAFVAEIVAFSKEMKANGETLELGDNAIVFAPPDLLAKMKSMDASQLKALIAELRSAKDLDGKSREGLIYSAFCLLAENQPQTALALFTDSPDLLKANAWMKDQVVRTALKKWAEQDPMAAVEWVRKNAEKFPDLITARSKVTMLKGISTSDPRLALKLVGELGFDDTWPALCGIATTAKTPENRTATLSALRDYLAALPGDESRKDLISRFTGSVAGEGFTSATQWFAGAGFTPAELEIVTGTLFVYIKKEDSEQWIQWVSENLPAGKSEYPIRRIVGRWAETDYQAVGQWLSTAPASPTKNVAIRSYAEAVSAYDPATATQWAMTLPPGPDRDATLKHIQDHSLAK